MRATVSSLPTEELLRNFWEDDYPYAALGEHLEAGKAVVAELGERWNAGERFDPPPFVLGPDELLYHLARHLREDPKGKKSAFFQMHVGIALQRAGVQSAQTLDDFIAAVRDGKPGNVTGPLSRELKRQITGQGE